MLSTEGAAGELRRRLTRLTATVRTGNDDGVIADAAALVADADADADAIGATALAAQAHALHGVTPMRASKFEDAVEAMRAGFTMALGIGRDHVALDAAANLGFAIGYRLGRNAEGRQWIAIADAMLRRLPSDDGSGEGLIRHNEAIHVVGLEVAVDDADPVGRSQPATGVSVDLDDLLPSAHRGAAPRPRVAALDQFHGDDAMLAVGADLVHRDHVRIGELCHRPRLPPHPSRAIAAADLVDLDRDPSREHEVGGVVDHAHRTGTDHAVEAVALADHRVGGQAGLAQTDRWRGRELAQQRIVEIVVGGQGVVAGGVHGDAWATLRQSAERVSSDATRKQLGNVTKAAYVVSPRPFGGAWTR